MILPRFHLHCQTCSGFVLYSKSSVFRRIEHVIAAFCDEFQKGQSSETSELNSATYRFAAVDAFSDIH